MPQHLSSQEGNTASPVGGQNLKSQWTSSQLAMQLLDVEAMGSRLSTPTLWECGRSCNEGEQLRGLQPMYLPSSLPIAAPSNSTRFRQTLLVHRPELAIVWTWTEMTFQVTCRFLACVSVYYLVTSTCFLLSLFFSPAETPQSADWHEMNDSEPAHPLHV